MAFCENLKAIMKEKGVKAADLARISGISKARISQYTHGVYIPKTDAAIKLADALCVDPSRLLGADLSDVPNHSHRHKYLPVIGEIACGYPVFARSNYNSAVIADESFDADFCLIAKGDSMKNARIQSGDIVFIRKCDSVNNGDIAAVIIGDEATLKRVYYYPDKEKLMLIPENPKYEPLVFTGNELEDIHIIGKAVAFRSELK